MHLELGSRGVGEVDTSVGVVQGGAAAGSSEGNTSSNRRSRCVTCCDLAATGPEGTVHCLLAPLRAASGVMDVL